MPNKRALRQRLPLNQCKLLEIADIKRRGLRFAPFLLDSTKAFNKELPIVAPFKLKIIKRFKQV